MKVTVESRNPREVRADLLVLLVPQLERAKAQLPSRTAALDRALGGRIATVVASGDFEGKAGQTALLYPDGAIAAARVLLLGLGTSAEIDADGLRRAAGRAVSQAAQRNATRIALCASRPRGLPAAQLGQVLAEGALLAGYRFDRYRSDDEAEAPADVKSVALCLERAGDVAGARAGARHGAILAESQNVARRLSNEPANALPPETLGREAQKVAREVGLHARVLDVPELRRRRMGALLAVGQGSRNTPRLLLLEHNRPRGRRGARRPARRSRTVCLVGKGITFDSGGLSIKPSQGMDEMKHDMSGAAAVVGALRACALLRLPLHVVGVVAAAENMPSGSAYRPGDVVTSMSGKTIEVLNTDAEGRVVLADALHYARTEYAPAAIIDLATLTGACVVALGNAASGLFGNHERLVEHLRAAGETTGERVWPMPLWKEHRTAVKSEIADVKNTAGREAASSTAAAFLAAFVGDTPWAHLDIAGTGWTSKPGPYQPRGATGVGVRLLFEALQGWKALALD